MIVVIVMVILILILVVGSAASFTPENHAFYEKKECHTARLRRAGR